MKEMHPKDVPQEWIDEAEEAFHNWRWLPPQTALRAALAAVIPKVWEEAHRAGAEAMRERAADIAERLFSKALVGGQIAAAIRALPDDKP